MSSDPGGTSPSAAARPTNATLLEDGFDPRGYPFIVKKQYPAASGRGIAVRKGTTGKVMDLSDDNWVKIAGWHKDTGVVNGWVPLQRLQIGRTHKFGDIEIVTDIVQVENFVLTDSTGGNIFVDACAQFLHAIRTSSKDSPFIPPRIRARTNRDPDLLQKIIGGVKQAGFFDTLSKPVFTVQELGDVVDPVKPNSTKRVDAELIVGGIYIVIYDNWKNDPARKPMVYVGKTYHFSKRWYSHDYALRTNIKGQHYAIGRMAGRARCFPICILPHNDLLLKTITEQLFVSLLETYNAGVQKMIISSDEINDDDADEEVDADEEAYLPEDREDVEDLSGVDIVAEDQENVESEEDSQVEDQEEDTTNEEMIGVEGVHAGENEEHERFEEARMAQEIEKTRKRYISMRLCAQVMLKLTKKVFAASAWPGACQRPSFNAQSTGLNSDSPIREKPTNEKTVWTKTVIPGVVESYRRLGLSSKTTGKKSGSQVTYFSMKTTDRKSSAFILTGKGNTGPPVGTVCHIVAEIRIDGRPHPYSLCAVPEISPWHNVDVVQRLAMAVEWSSGGQWKKMYIRRGKQELLDRNIPGALYSLAFSFGLIAFFRQMDEQPFGWAKQFHRADVRKVTFDFLTQTLSIMRANNETSEMLGKPHRTSQATLEAKIAALGVTLVGSWRPTHITSRKTCDACFVSDGEHKLRGRRQGYGCARVEGTNMCKQCNLVGLPCTWTPTANIEANNREIYNRLKHALVLPGRWVENFSSQQGSIQKIFDVRAREFLMFESA